MEFKILFEKKKRYTFRHKTFDEKTLTEILNEYARPKITIGILCNQNTFVTLNKIIKESFKDLTFKLIRSKYISIDIEDTDIQKKLIIHQHDQGNHRGIYENIQKIRRKYYFPKLKVLVNSIVNKCETCQLYKYNRLEKPIQFEITETPANPLEIIHIDVFSIDNCNYLTIIDKFTKFGSAYQLSQKKGTEICM